MVHLHYGYIWCGILLLSYLKYHEMGLFNSMLNKFTYPCTKCFLFYCFIHTQTVFCCDVLCLSMHKLLFVLIFLLVYVFLIRAQIAGCCDLLFAYPCTNRLMFCCVVCVSIHKLYVGLLCCFCFIHAQTVCSFFVLFCV